jgi:hypothetical protein
MPVLADIVKQHGADLANRAAMALYRGGPTGWFAGEDAAQARAEWLSELVRSAESGRYAGVLQASDVLLRRAYLQTAGLLERYGFVDRFGRVVLHALGQADAPHSEIAAARRLFAAVQQAHLDGRP